MRNRKFIRQSDGKVFQDTHPDKGLYHPVIHADDGETDVVKCYAYESYVSLDKGHTYRESIAYLAQKGES